MAEAVRPKKKKTKQTGKSQGKKQERSEGINQAGRHGPIHCEKDKPLLSLHEDVESLDPTFRQMTTSQPSTLNLSTEHPAAEQKHPECTAHTQKEQDQFTSVENVENEITWDCINKMDAKQSKDSTGDFQFDNDLLKIHHNLTELTCDKKALDYRLSPLANSIPILYPQSNATLTAQIIEPQLFSVKDQNPIGSELNETSNVQDKMSKVLCSLEEKAPAVLSLADEESSVSSLVPVHSIKMELGKVQKIYPELSELYSDPQELRGEQLKMWDPASLLKNVEVHAAEFDVIAHQEGHELHELLQQYWRSCHQLSQSQAKLQAANSECKSTQNRLWSFRDEQLTLQGVCADQTKVCGYHRFQQAVLNETVLAELQHQFKTKIDLVHQTVAMHIYTTMLSHLQVDSYLYYMLRKNPVTMSVVVDESVTDCPDLMAQPSSLQPLKTCISILFSFTRRILEDKQFQDDVHMWLRKLVSVLHRVGSSEDHLYLLNHLLCCPSGVGEWAVSFLQVKVLDDPSGMNHFMQALAILMSPVRNRADFLCHLRNCDSKTSSSSNSDRGPGSGNWTLVDEGGEEEEDPETSWLLLSEDDLLSFFSQFPFDELFKNLLGLTVKGEYGPKAKTRQEIMKVFDFTSCLLEVLAFGLQTYNRARYRRFVKRIGYTIRLALCYVSDHWAQYKSLQGATTSVVLLQSMDKLQEEFDLLFFRAVLHVLRAKRLGIWLFMSGMPYGTLSSAMLWKIYHIMQRAETEDLEGLCSNLSIGPCTKVTESENQDKFECWLSEMNSSDGICLLTTLARMAEPNHSSVDPEFVSTVVLKIYQVSYVSMTTRENFSKVGRELLSSIATSHPHIISVLLERLQETIDRVGMVSLYLFKELPLHLWKPATYDMRILHSWLLDYSLITVENKLACIILERLNWSFSQDGFLALEPALHTEVSLLVVEAYQKHLTDKPYEGIVSEGIKQVSYLANVVRLGCTPEASFSNWAWDLVLRLKLHMTERCPKDTWTPASPSSTLIPQLSDSPIMYPVLKAVKTGLPIGCFLAISVTTIGHSLEKFCSEGLDLLWTLVSSRQLRAVLQILENFLPLAYSYPFYLLKNEQFLRCIRLFLQLESGTPQGMAQQVTQKVAQHLTKSSYGENIKLLNSIIQAHVSESCKAGRVGPAAVLEFWVQMLTGQDFWHREKPILFLMDNLCQAAVLHKQEECIQKVLYQQHKRLLGFHGDRGLWSSLVSWFVAGNVTPSFIEGHALTDEVWFAWLTLNMEAIFEEDSQLRLCVEHELLSNPTISPEQALKKAQARLKLPVVPSMERMMVYRWTHQALATSADHPLLPLVWQRFLQLYLHQPGPEFGLETKGCIGRRFFQSSAHTALLKELKQRLIQVSDFHHAASKALKIPPATSEEDPTLLYPCPQYITSPELHTELVRLFSVFMVWLEDENLQLQEVYLPSLPKQHDPHRLAKIMHNQQELWMEFVDMERVQHEVREAAQLCKKVRAEPSLLQNNSNSIFTDFFSPQAAQERILMNLRKHVRPQPALELVSMRPPVPDIAHCCLSDDILSSKLLQEDLKKLQHQAKLAVLRETQQVALHSELLESLPQLHSNHEEKISMRLECKGSGGRPCQGPALITAMFEVMRKSEPVHNQIQSLNSDVRQLQTEATKRPPQCVAEAAVHVERFITALVNGFKAMPTSAIRNVGVAAFYHLVSFVCEDTQRYPPTRQFFSSCIEVLGQVFVQGVQSECRRLLKTILLNRHLCTLLSPYFTPNASPGELVDMYGEVVGALHTDSGDITFMLLTKFDMSQWFTAAQPSFSDRSRLVEHVHLALSFCGMEPESEVLMPFNLFCKHWAQLLCYQFPDHYSDCLRLLIQSCSEQLLSPECWRSFLQVLGCSPKMKAPTILRSALALDSISLSPQQVDETIEWLSSFLTKLRMSNPDFHSFGLYCKWSPYIGEIKIFLAYLVNYIVDMKVIECAKEPPGSSTVLKVLLDLDSKIQALFKPWILVEESSDAGQRCFPWLETDNNTAAQLVDLYTQLTCSLHEKFKSLLQSNHRDSLWLHLIHYCDNCTAPKTPEYLLSTYHSTYRSLPWKELYPDQTLMNKFFNVERGSPKSCFLFLGEVLCEVNWVSVLKDALGPQPSPADQSMVIYLFYMMVFLAKEEHLLLTPESPLLNLLGQSSFFPWYFVDLSSYQNVIGYVDTHYSPTLILSKNDSSKQIFSLLQMAAGFGSNGSQYKDITMKCQSYIRLMVKFLISLDQNGKVSLISMEQEFEKLLECIVLFSPPETDLQQRHMAISSLFAELLTLLNSTDISTAEVLAARVHSWVVKRANSHLALALLTASCYSLASVRHMTHTTETCILAYFADMGPTNHFSGWGPILASMKVPELTVKEFIKESLAMGSFLTLFVYILQKLNLEQTFSNEQKTLALLNTWINEVFPSGPADEAKLFLWWHKALQLTLLQLDKVQTLCLESLLLSLQNRMTQLSDERLSSGLLGAIGLGRKSPLSSRFRVVARSMSAFLLSQVSSDSQVRITPEMDLEMSAKAQQALAALESMSESKQYSEFKLTLDQTCQFIKYRGHCLQDWSHLFALLINSLYVDIHFLDILRD
ncbi:ectopic P granules protein 5 homolog [Paramormyrops kingsleyae]|uniref:ectopic P granules protein 5 homolog n=1 Tax=Paramormyrops kingsleyae TaxID=1676925 RepID=UPI003B96BC40